MIRLLFLGFLCVPLLAQEPPALDSGIGSGHMKVTTSNAEAQRYFDQGMRYVYAFNHEAAVRSFQHATQLDPNLALGYWGVALALGPNINMDVDPDREKQAWDGEQSALNHAASASPRERDMIDALAKRYTNDPKADLHKLQVEYSGAMRELSKKYADDPDIATLYAESLMDLRPWKFWTHDGKPVEDTEEIVRVLESVLAKHPNHVGANHYYIHAVEASLHPERALPSARRFQTLAPAAGHLVHMPAHIYQRTGNYAGAADANERAAAVDRKFMEKYGHESMYAAMYYNHNLQFGSASYAMEGRYADAKRMADEFGAAATAMAKQMAPLDVFAAAPLLTNLRFGRWREVLSAADPKAGPVSTGMWHFARGVAFAQLGNVSGAQSEQKMFEASRAGFPDDPGFMQNTPRALGEVASNVLAGRIAMATADRKAAIAAYRRAVELEDALNYDEPADWFYPTRETLGAALLLDGQLAEAEAVFRADLEHNKHNPRSLWGLARTLLHERKDSSKASAEFRRLWKGAPLKLESY
jgi:tetratricopeptide (TPR) repeat protein